ncbi:hypothetical protein GJ688_05685 [Heliobacillus mobilis]|uniref:Septum formation initiator n=1 Tax=Heliobacterium mobile TaxID=28064 RepID=A0A6I3SI51_HELMO|nr:septum formation initiator family protein [Heliobacterium mobile]MTV48475.1 hypothetical protein [Heliobacterium mobile]
MKRAKARSNRKKKMLLIGAGIGLLALAAVPPYLQHRELAQEADRLSADLEQVRTEHGQMQKEKEWLSSDAYVEQVARQQLGLVRPGEVIVVRAKQSNGVPMKKDANGNIQIRD